MAHCICFGIPKTCSLMKIIFDDGYVEYRYLYNIRLLDNFSFEADSCDCDGCDQLKLYGRFQLS